MSRTVSLATLGCKTNQFESAAMQQRLAASGYRVIPFEDGAELVIVNTCTVTAATDSQSRNLIRRARRFNPQCRVVVTGCYAQVDPRALARLPGVSLVLGNEEKNLFLEHLETASDGEVAVGDIRSVDSTSVLPLSSWSGRSRAFVQIQNGCDAFCSYCIIPYARGVSRSVAEQDVLEQLRILQGQQVPEVVLTGIHVGGYGHDLNPPTTLATLVRRVVAETGLPRVRLGSVEPLEISEELIDVVAGHPNVCNHLHIPLQSGDNDILARMNRHYTRERFGELIARLVERIPGVSIGLDVIAGFPGETDQQFANTFELIESLPISYLHVFPFSRRPGTPAAAMPQQVPAQIVKERAAHLRELGSRSHRTYIDRFVGKELEMVVESGRFDGMRKGVSREYLDVRYPISMGPDSGTVRVTAEKNCGDWILGRVLD